MTGPLARREPLTKLAAGLVIVVYATVAERWQALAPLAGLIVAALLLAERIGPRRLAWALLPFLVFTATTSWIYLVAPAANYAGHAGSGLAVGLLVGLRTITIGLASIAVVLTTEPADLARALLGRTGLSRRFVYGALAAIQFLPALGEEARVARLVARAAVPDGRGAMRLATAVRRGLAVVSPAMALVLIGGAVRRANGAALSMELRGLGRPATRPEPPPWTGTDGALLASTTAAVVSLHWLGQP